MPNKALSISKIVERLSGTRDLFTDTISESYVIEAGKRWLGAPGDSIWKAEVLEQHAESLAEMGYYGLAAQLATEASLQVARSDYSYTATWRNCVTDASTYWDATGRLDEKQSIFLRLSGIAMRAGKQLNLLSISTAESQYRPVWILAKDFHRASDFAQSAAIYDALHLESTAREDYYDARQAALYAAFEYAHLESWSESFDRALTAIETKRRNTAFDEVSFTAHVVAGICCLRIKPNGELKEAFRYLMAAKQILRKWKTRNSKKQDRKWLFHWIGSAYADLGHDLLIASNHGANRAMLNRVEDAYRKATDYLIKADDTRKFVGDCFAIQGAMARLLGDGERAAMLEAKAIVYGHMP